MKFYLTFNDKVSGVYISQVIDVVKFLNNNLNEKFLLVAFISLRDFKNQKKIIKQNIKTSLVLPMFPKLRLWKLNSLTLSLICLFYKPDLIIARNVFACHLALYQKQIRKKLKVVYDGRGAVKAEWQEYNIIKDPVIFKNAFLLENNAIKKSDFLLSVSNKLVQYWHNEYNYNKHNYVVIPCTLGENFKSIQPFNLELKRSLGFELDDIILVYSGSIAGWQSMNLIYDFCSSTLNQDNIKLLFLSDEADIIKTLKEEFPERVKNFKVPSDEVRKYLSICDYGMLIREPLVTNIVASPVKFAEYLSSGLSVIISAQVGDYSDFVKTHNCGFILSENSFAFKQLSDLDRQRNIQLSSLFYKERYVEEYRKIVSV